MRPARRNADDPIGTVNGRNLQEARINPLVRPSLLLVLVAAAATVAIACSGADGPATDGERTRVVATVPIIGEFAGRIAGPDAEVTTLIPLGVDEHSFQPSTTVARTVAEADLALVNGYRLEEALLSIVVQNARDGVPVVAVARGLEPLAGGHDDEEDHVDEDDHADEAPTASDGAVDGEVFAEGDPHFWLDAQHAVRYAENIRDALVALDPDHADGYRERADALVAELQALDAELRESLAVIPAERRKIVTFHDAFEYFAGAYDFEVIASVAPANPNQAASAAAIARIIATVRDAGVPTIFREPQYSGQSLDLIAQESGTAVAVLYSVPTDDVPTYAEMMRANARALVEGLSP